MYGTLKRNHWQIIAATVLFFFSTVLFLHPFIPHSHFHEISGSGLFLTVHTGGGERELLLFALVTVLGTMLPRTRLFDLLYCASRRNRQRTAIPIVLFLCALFSQGVLHSKAH